MKFLGKLLLWLVGGLLLTLAIIVALLLVSGLRSVPSPQGDALLPGLEDTVLVSFDENGLPTVRAGSMRDAYRALGYLHARDRLWQMESMRRVGSGRLSEILGPSTIGIDTMMRELGLWRQAEDQHQGLAEEERADFQAYADGVNAYLTHRKGPLPIEFQLTFHSPEAWTVEDSLLWGRLMSLQLSDNGFKEAFRDELNARIGPEMLATLFPSNDKSPTTLNDDNQNAWLPGYDASNAWVLDGSQTATGSPILANDPHLGLGLPGQWYLARIETPALTLVGVTAPGVPLHVLGHNGQIAWGMTTTHADNQDTVLVSAGSLEAATTREEVISVRFSQDVSITVVETKFGPILSRFGAEPRALQWTGAAGGLRTASALYRLNRARDWADFTDALALFDDPVQNVFYADRQGHIGMKVVGRLPIRAEGGTGLLPIEGRDPSAKWIDVLPPSALPGILDPDDGKILNANNRVVSGQYPHMVSHDFVESYRVDRLIELIGGQDDPHELSDSMDLQTDILSVAARRLVPHLLMVEPRTEASARALRVLEFWDFRMNRNLAAPAIYATYLNEVVRALVEDELGSDLLLSYWRSAPSFVEKALSEETHWCDNTLTDPVEPCARVLSIALDRAVAKLTEEMGEDIKDWRWGDVHRAPMAHPLLGRIPGLAWLGNRPLDTDGGDHTMNRGQHSSGARAPNFSHGHGASYRAIYDLSDLDNSLYALAGGQSGNPFSPFYGSLLDDWRDGRYFRIPGRQETITDGESTLLRLHP